LHKAVEIARDHYHANKIYLEAQQYAIGYYGKEGFIVTSEPFLEDGIPHVQMELSLGNDEEYYNDIGFNY
ncbi:MAG: GNAT family N-acetyltransferase, partial [Lachnospiraceae bacterium]|nr:GNAT family N-acetyltransferase [Lachnospiraceae bacterium]